jgi:hypothetical protein
MIQCSNSAIYQPKIFNRVKMEGRCPSKAVTVYSDDMMMANDGRVWSGFIWLRIGTNDWLL